MKALKATAAAPLRCLCTSVGNDGFAAVHAALKAYYGAAIAIVGCDARPDAYGLYLADKGYVVPRREDPAFVGTMLSIAANEQCSILYPLSTFDQEYFAENYAFYSRRGLQVIVSDALSVGIANDKVKFYDLCRALGIPVAPFYPVRDTESLEVGLRALGYPERPVVFKPARSTGARGLAIVDEQAAACRIHRDDLPRVTGAELARTLTGTQRAVLCEYLPGDEYSVDVLSRNGAPIVSVVRRRYASTGGLALHAEVVEDHEVRKLAEAIVRELRLDYTSNVQIRRDRRGVARIMEVNPRIPGTIGLTVQAGVNMPALALELACGRKPPDRFSIRVGMRVIRHWGAQYHNGPLLKAGEAPIAP